MSLGQTGLDFLDQISRKFIVNIQFGIPGKLDRVAIDDIIAGKHISEVVPDNIIQNDEILAFRIGGKLNKPWQVIRGYFDNGKFGARLAGFVL